MNSNDIFKIGPRNVEAVLRILADYHLTPHRMDVGGTYGRTVEVSAVNGEISIYRSPLIG